MRVAVVIQKKTMANLTNEIGPI